MVECTALEMRHTGNRIGGSNPPLSASSNCPAPSAVVYVKAVQERGARSLRASLNRELASRGLGFLFHFVTDGDACVVSN